MMPKTDDKHDDKLLEPELEGAPSNDNDEADEGYVVIDLETDPDNDNAEPKAKPKRKKTSIERDPRRYGYVSAQPGRLEQLLDRAGYDPALIPQAMRRTAFEIALCWQKRMFDEDDLRRTLRFSRGTIERATHALRVAARAGTVVG